MKKFMRSCIALLSLALTSALFGNQSIDLGYVGGGTVSLAFESTWDSSMAIIDNDTNQVVAELSILDNTWYNSSYSIYGGGYVSGVAVTQTNWQGAEVTGLPPGNYRLQSYTQWGNNSPSSYSDGSYAIEYAPWNWGFYQVSFFYWTS